MIWKQGAVIYPLFLIMKNNAQITYISTIQYIIYVNKVNGNLEIDPSSTQNLLAI